MPVSASTKRRFVIVFLVTLIGVALASIFQTSIDSELLPPKTAFALGASLSPSSTQRQYYQLRGTQQALFAEIDAARQQSGRNRNGAADYTAQREWSRRMHEQLTHLAGDYQQFLEQHPKHLAAHLACIELMDRLGDDRGATLQRETALALAPNNADLCNEMANHYMHAGNAPAAFDHYTRAVALAPREPIYQYNLATAIFLYRRDSMAYYHVNEQQIFDRALQLFNHAVELNPANLQLAADVAMTYFSIKPFRVEGALAAWNRLYQAAPPGVQRQEAALNLARVSLEAGRLKEAHRYLDEVTHEFHRTNKERLTKRLVEKENLPAAVTVVPASLESQ